MLTEVSEIHKHKHIYMPLTSTHVTSVTLTRLLRLKLCYKINLIPLLIWLRSWIIFRHCLCVSTVLTLLTLQFFLQAIKKDMTEILPSQSNGLMSFNREHLFQPLIKFGSLKSLIYVLKLCTVMWAFKTIQVNLVIRWMSEW